MSYYSRYKLYPNTTEQHGTTCITFRTFCPIACVKAGDTSVCADLLTVVITVKCHSNTLIICYLVMMGEQNRMRGLPANVTHHYRSIPSFSVLSGKHTIHVSSSSLLPQPSESIAPPSRSLCLVVFHPSVSPSVPCPINKMSHRTACVRG